MRLTLARKDLSRLLSTSEDETLDDAVRARMREHLVVCLVCRNVEEQLDFIRRAMGRLGPDEHSLEDPPPLQGASSGTAAPA